MPKLLTGAEVVKDIIERAKEEADALKTYGITPQLAIVRVGERPDDLAYERGATKRCVEVGVSVRQLELDADAGTEELLEVIDGLNDDPTIHGVLLLRPLPKGIDEAAVCDRLKPQKDVDGITMLSLAGTFTGVRIGFPSCTAAAVLEMLDYYDIDVSGKNVAVVGRSMVAGRPAAMLLMARDATVTICHRQTRDLKAAVKAADIVVVAAGTAGIADDSFFSPGQAIIDVGINLGEDGKLHGDVSYTEALPAAAITPVPGGVGAVTAAVLVKHVVKAAKNAV
ncbi:bifunctional protein FolD [Clostridia bacterium]|nr:bifunctional protein FolD [Clostridia bacterium]